MYFLIEDKSAVSYKTALDVLCELCPDFKPQTVMVDFETGEHSAIRAVFPTAVIKGCLFHFKQCIMRKYMKLPGYSENELMKSDLSAVYGLAFLPVHDVIIGWNLIKAILQAQYPAATAEFIRYFEANWIYSTKYPLEMWNCYAITLSDDPRTNNLSEGSNNALNVSAGCSSPTICKFVDILRRFNSEAELKILQSSTGMNANRKKRNKFVIRDERIKRTVLAYNPANKLSYCRSLGHLYE